MRNAQRLAQANAETHRWAEKQLLKVCDGKGASRAAASIVRVVHAMREGLFTLRFLTPELITDELIVAAFEALASAGPQKSKRRAAGKPKSQRRRRKIG